MILPIYIEPQPILHQATELITEITPDIKQLALNMRETMQNAQGIGLAAPQIGHSLALIVIEMEMEEEEDTIPFQALLNPRITWRSKKTTSMLEGCLSLPGIEGLVVRPERVRVKAKNLAGETLEIEADQMLARILQHEIDHLHGVLFTEYVPSRRLKSRPLNDYPQL